MRTALIGHTGFVGSNIAAAHPFDDLYNTTNIADLRGRSYDLVVSAAARADSHRINAQAAQDRAEIDAFIELLSTVETKQLVLVSTVCIYPGGVAADETWPLTAEGLTPYGVNRLHMEQVLSDRFATLSLRLPHLYGLGIRKGIVYDLLNDYRVEFIRPESRFQYYDLRRLWADTQVALDAGLSRLNVATPPLRSDRVAAEVFGRDISGQVIEGEYVEAYTRDLRTVHNDLFGGPAGFLMDEEAALAALAAYVAEVRASSAG